MLYLNLLRANQYPALDLALAKLSPLNILRLTKIPEMGELRQYLSDQGAFHHLFHVRGETPNLVSALERDILDYLDLETVNYWQLWLSVWYAVYSNWIVITAGDYSMEIYEGAGDEELVGIQTNDVLFAKDVIRYITKGQEPSCVALEAEEEGNWYNCSIDSERFNPLWTLGPAQFIPSRARNLVGIEESARKGVKGLLAYLMLGRYRNTYLQHGERFIRSKAN